MKRLLRETFGVAPLTYEVGTDGLAPVLIGWTLLPEITVSLSHSAGLGAASWAWAASEGSVGVDAQHIRPAHPGLAARALTPASRRRRPECPDGLLLFWALKEAAIKARRQAWGRPLRDITVTLDAPGDERGHGAHRHRRRGGHGGAVCAIRGLVGRAGGSGPSR